MSAANAIPLSVAAINAALSAVAGEPVRLLECRPTAGSPFWMVVPVERARIAAPFWKEVQGSPMRGTWATAERAVAGFCAGAKGWVAAAAAKAPSAQALLLKHLDPGPIAAAVLYAKAADAGISATALDRAARQLRVERRKSSLRGGWVWGLPAKGSGEDFEGRSADMGASDER